MTIKELQDRILELERQTSRLKEFMESYKTGRIDFDELTAIVSTSMDAIQNLSRAERRRAA